MQGFSNIEKEFQQSRTGRTSSKQWKGPLKYEAESPKNAGAGKKVTPKQRDLLRNENKLKNGGLMRSDGDGRILNMPKRLEKGQKADMNQIEIDHIIPKSKGGTNASSNAQVLLKKENLKKGNK